MRKWLFFFCFTLLSFASHSQRKTISGNWTGSLDVGMKLRIVFHFATDSSGKITATMDSPDQNAKGILVSSVTLTEDSLHAAIAVAKGRYDGAFINDTTLSGTWSQGIAKLPLRLTKTDHEIALNRPQTPRPPFNYISKDIEYDNSTKSVHFGGTLTYPKTAGPFPSIILISGSGQQDRDETLFEHKPFAVLADHLTKNGFAVLRVDDRGVGKTTGDVKSATSADFANDVEAGIAFLKTLPQTDTNHLGLIGHSEGGLIASMLASRRKDIDFIVLMASPGMKGFVLMTDQAEAVLNSMKIEQAVNDSYKNVYTAVLNKCIANSDTAQAYKEVWSSFEKWKRSVPTSVRAKLGFTNDDVSQKILHAMVSGFSNPWMKYFLKSDASQMLKKTSAKVLALNGEKDVQVLPKNLEGIKVALQQSKSKGFEVKMLPGLNHLFQKCTECTVAEYAQLEETINPEALTIIASWLNNNVRNK